MEQQISDQPIYQKIINQQDLLAVFDKSNTLYNREQFGGDTPLPLIQVFKKKFNEIVFLAHSFNFLQPLWWDEEINTKEEQQIYFDMFKCFLRATNQNSFYMIPSDSHIELALHFTSPSFSFDEYWQALREVDKNGFQIDAAAEVLVFVENGSWAMLSDIHSELVFVGLDKELSNYFKTCFHKEIMSIYDAVDFLSERRGGDLSENVKAQIFNLYTDK